MSGSPTWPRRPLGDVLRIKHGYAFKGDYFSDSGTHIVLTPGNFFDQGGFRLRGEKDRWYTGPIPSGYVLRRGDLIVAMTEQAEGLLGSSAKIPEDSKYLHNQRLGLVEELSPGLVDKDYIYHLFNSAGVRKQIRATANGAKVRHTSPDRIYRVSIAFPPLPIQQRIASILSAYDNLIENNLRRIKILEEMAQSLYKEWFVDFRFPGHESVKMVDSPLGMVPEGWRVASLRDVAAVNASTVRRGCEPDEIEYVDISSVTPGRVEKTERMRFGQAPGRARRIVAHGDVVWSAVRPNRRSFALILDPPPNLICSTGFAVLTPRLVPFSFLYAATTTDEFTGYLVGRATGAAYPAVTASVFEEASILTPSDTLLGYFDELAGPLRLLQHRLVGQSRLLAETRDLLLPKLVSGEIDISHLDIDIGEDAA